MSWLDLPPIELIGAAPSVTGATSEPGVTKGLVGLVAAGLFTFWSEHQIEVWRPQNPAALAAVLGVGEVERIDMGDGFAECGYLDRTTNQLRLRNRNPRSGAPRAFPVQPNGLPDAGQDPHAIWQLTHMADVAVRRDERWELQPGGYGSGPLTLGVELGQWQGQRRIIVTATPAMVGRRWTTGHLGIPKVAGAQPTRAAGVPLTRPGLDQAVKLLSSAMDESGLSPWEFMPVFPTA